MKSSPERLLDPSITVDNLFDSFNNVIWNGGRIRVGEDLSLLTMERRIKSINDLGVGVRFTFTNSLLTEEHLRDPYANQILEMGHNKQNSVTLTSELLREHIKETYPKYKLVGSVTHVNYSIDWFRTQMDKYDIMVLPVEFNHDLSLLESLPDHNRIELLVNEGCAPYCAHRKEHYQATSQDQLEGSPFEDSRTRHIFDTVCPLRKANAVEVPVTHLYFKELMYLNSLGYGDFKLTDRSGSWYNQMKKYIEYFIKEEAAEALWKKYSYFDDGSRYH